LWCALMLGEGLAVHHLIGVTIIVLFVAYKGLRKWKYVGVVAAFLLFYLYIPITAARTPIDMWGNTTLGSFFRDNVSTVLMLWGGLSIWDLPKRVLDAIGVLGVSLGLALMPVVYFSWKRKWYKEPLIWLLMLPVIYYCTNLAPQTYCYMLPAIGFGAVIAGIGLARMRPCWKWAVLVCAIGLLAFNANYLDIGRTLDPDLSASKYYYEELNKVPDGEILLPQYDWEWAAIFPYNKENNRNIIPVCIGTLLSPLYQTQLKTQGVKLIDYQEGPIDSRSALITSSIVKLNDNVWTTQPTTPETYGTVIVPTNNRQNIFEVAPNTEPKIQWKPSNPYNIITGVIEIEKWKWITFSNYSCLMFGMLAVIGGVPTWIGWNLIVRRKKWSLRRSLKRTRQLES